MSHVIAPEITINSTPLLLDLCSDTFRLETHELSLPDLEDAAKSIKEACSVTSKSINNAKANILMAFMADPTCRRWLKKEFQKRVDCDNTLLTKIAREVGFKFYTAEAIILEELDACGEGVAVEVVAKRAGVTEKAVERVKTKLERKREDELLTQQIALEVALASDKDEHAPATVVKPELDSVQFLDAEVVASSKEDEEELVDVHTHDAETAVVAAVEPKQAALSATTPQVAAVSSAPSMAHVKVITSKVKKKLEADYLKEIDVLKNMLAEKDAEIARLKGMLERQAD